MAKNSRKKQRSLGSDLPPSRSSNLALRLWRAILRLIAFCLGFIWRRAISATALKVYVVAAMLLTVYVVYLDATIRDTFEGKKWQLPARVYARPLEIFEGLPLRAEQLEAELVDLGYQRGSLSSAGSYFRRGNVVGIFSRGHQFWDGNEPPEQVKVTFDRSGVARLQRLSGQDLPLLRLEPLSIGAIYPRHREDRILVQYSEVPPLLIAALIAVEDHRFYAHRGISPKSIARAALANFKQGSVVQGGSTITQQLVKNYYLSKDRTVRRKLTEALMSVLLEIHYPKEAILEAYLNEVYLGQAGARAIHGFGLASQHYFNRDIDELSVEKLALLVALVRGPTFYDPWRHPERAIKRRDLVIDTLVREQLLAESDAAWAKAQPLGLGKQTRSHYVFPAYLDLVKRQLTEHYSHDDLTSNGLKIYTSFDPLVQRATERAIINQLEPQGDDKMQAAAIVTHPATGEVLAVVGGRQPRFAGFNRALDAKRSIGSTIKPFVYIAALSLPERYHLATLLSDAPIAIETVTDGDKQIWSPKNFDRKSHGNVALIDALAHSYNQATARLGDEVGIAAVVDVLGRAGLRENINAVPSMFIGTTQLSPLDVAQLYQTLAANGFKTPIKAIRAVLDSDNKPLKRFPFEVEQVLDDKAAYLMQRALIHVAEQGSAKAARWILPRGFSFAGKTGTSGDQRDSWFAGYTGDVLAVVWVGRDDNTPTSYTGSSAALPIWANLVGTVSHAPLRLPRRDDLDYIYVDLSTGRLSRKRCETAIELPFIIGSGPVGRAICSPRAQVD